MYLNKIGFFPNPLTIGDDDVGRLQYLDMIPLLLNLKLIRVQYRPSKW